MYTLWATPLGPSMFPTAVYQGLSPRPSGSGSDLVLPGHSPLPRSPLVAGPRATCPSIPRQGTMTSVISAHGPSGPLVWAGVQPCICSSAYQAEPLTNRI